MPDDFYPPWFENDAFDEWIRELQEDVIQGQYGYEEGEFDVYSGHCWPLYEEGLTPLEAWKRALQAFKENRANA